MMDFETLSSSCSWCVFHPMLMLSCSDWTNFSQHSVFPLEGFPYMRLIYISVHTLVNVPTYVATVLKNKIYSIKWNGFLSMERIAKHVIHKCQWNRLHGCETNPDLRDRSYPDRRSIRSWCNGWTSARLLSQEIFLCRSDSTSSRRQCFCHRWFQFSPPATFHLPRTIFVSSLLRTFRQSNLLRGSSPEWTRTSEMDAASKNFWDLPQNRLRIYFKDN